MLFILVLRCLGSHNTLYHIINFILTSCSMGPISICLGITPFISFQILCTQCQRPLTSRGNTNMGAFNPAQILVSNFFNHKYVCMNVCVCNCGGQCKLVCSLFHHVNREIELRSSDLVPFTHGGILLAWLPLS